MEAAAVRLYCARVMHFSAFHVCSVLICTILISLQYYLRLFTKLIVAVLSVVFHTQRFVQYVTGRYR